MADRRIQKEEPSDAFRRKNRRKATGDGKYVPGPDSDEDLSPPPERPSKTRRTRGDPPSATSTKRRLEFREPDLLDDLEPLLRRTRTTAPAHARSRESTASRAGLNRGARTRAERDWDRVHELYRGHPRTEAELTSSTGEGIGQQAGEHIGEAVGEAVGVRAVTGVWTAEAGWAGIQAGTAAAQAGAGVLGTVGSAVQGFTGAFAQGYGAQALVTGASYIAGVIQGLPSAATAASTIGGLGSNAIELTNLAATSAADYLSGAATIIGDSAASTLSELAGSTAVSVFNAGVDSAAAASIAATAAVTTETAATTAAAVVPLVIGALGAV